MHFEQINLLFLLNFHYNQFLCVGPDMSGITGIFRRDGQDVDPADIKKMNDKISHRGPDGSRVWCEGPVAFGHQMLHTTQESLHEILPFEDEESGLVITADARIDNRKDLAPLLGIEDNEYVSDSYFILKAYEKWGEKCPEELLGDFAFVIWDKIKKTLFCARDHIGIKPFYYYLDENYFLFSTEIKAIKSFKSVSFELNRRMFGFFLMNIHDYNSTFFNEILHLTPAHFINLHFSKFEVNEYWKINPIHELILNSEEEYANKFREIFQEAVKCRLRSHHTFGFELSGGMDSSSVVCMANEILNTENNVSTTLKTFSFIFNNFPQCDERDYIEIIKSKVRIDATYVKADNISPLKDIDAVLWYQEQPLLTPNLTITWEMYKKIKERNIRVVLCGEGGDSVVSEGAGYFTDLLVNFRFIKLIKEIYYLSRRTNQSFLGLFLNALYPLVPSFIKKMIYADRLPGISLLNNEFSRKINANRYWKLYWEPIKKANTAKKKHFYSLDHSKAIINALLVRDKRAAAFNIEDRYPFLDKRLVEFCFSIPTEMKFKDGWSRYILRISMADILPINAQWRTSKANLSPVFKRNILSFEKETIEEMLFIENKNIGDYANIEMIKEIYEKFKDGIEVSNSPYSLWLVLQLYIWLKKSK